MRRAAGMVAAVGFALVVLLSGAAPGADTPNREKPITAGPLVLNPRDVIAVYRPADGSSVGFLLAKPGGAIQQIVLKDFREATAAFNDLWNNEHWVKDPGEDDHRPLTRMLVKAKEGEDPTKRVPTLILNTDRVLGMAWDSDRHVAHVYVDRPAGGAAADETLELTRDEAENVITAYKASLVR